MKKRVSIGERSFTFFNNTFLILLALICIVPFLNIIATSFASTQEVVAKKFILFPTTFSLDAYRYILSTPTIFRALAVSIGVTGVGTIVSMCATSLMAYGLSRKYLFGRGFVNFLVVFSMLFSGGMIPTFLVVRSLGLVNSYWAMILPVAVNAMNMIIMRNFFQALPDSLEESANGWLHRFWCIFQNHATISVTVYCYYLTFLCCYLLEHLYDRYFVYQRFI